MLLQGNREFWSGKSSRGEMQTNIEEGFVQREFKPLSARGGGS